MTAPIRQRRSFRFYGAVSTGVLFLLVFFAIVYMQTTKPSPETLDDIRNLLPPDFAVLDRNRPVLAPASDASPTTFPLPNASGDFWINMEQAYPELFRHPRMQALYVLDQIRDNDTTYLASGAFDQSAWDPDARQRFLLFLSEFRDRHSVLYPKIDLLLADEPLPWPPARAMIGWQNWIENQRYYRENLHALIAADAYVASDGAGLSRNLVRLLRMDRHLVVDYPCTDSYLSVEQELRYLVDWFGGSRGIFPLDRFRPEDAADVLRECPAPQLETREHRLALMRIEFAQQRHALTYSDEALFSSFIMNNIATMERNVPEGTDTESLGHASLFVFRVLLLKIRFYGERDDYLRQIADAQHRVDEMVRNEPLAGQDFKSMLKSNENDFLVSSAGSATYPVWSLDSRNDRRILVHAVLTARALEEADPAARDARLADLSDRFAAGRLLAEPTSAGLALALGDFHALVPAYAPPQLPTTP